MVRLQPQTVSDRATPNGFHDRSASGMGDKGAGAVFYVRRQSCLGAPAPALHSAVAQWSWSGTKQALNSHMKFARENIIDLTTKEF